LRAGDGGVGGGPRCDVEPVRNRIERRGRLQPDWRGAVGRAENEKGDQPRQRGRPDQRYEQHGKGRTEPDGEGNVSLSPIACLSVLLFRVGRVDLPVIDVVDPVEEDVRWQEEAGEQHDRRGRKQFADVVRGVGYPHEHRARQI